MESHKYGGGQAEYHSSSIMCGPHSIRDPSGFQTQNSRCDYSDESFKEFPQDESNRNELLSPSRKESKLSTSQVRLQETFINVGSLEDDQDSEQQNEVWKQKRKHSLCPGDLLDYTHSSPVTRETHPLEENIIFSMAESVFNVFLIVLVSIPITLLIGVIFPFAILAKFLSTACSGKNYYSCTLWRTNKMSAHDAQFFLHGNQPPIHSILIVEGSIDLKRVRHMLSSRVVQAKTGSGDYMYPKLTQTVVHLPSGPTWFFDNKFNLHNHIFSGPEITSEEALQKYIAKLLFQPLHTSRPLWEVIVLNSFGQKQDTVLICRLHHCIADGMSLLRVLCQSLSDNQILHIPQKPHFGGTTFGMNLFRSLFVGPLTAMTWIYWWKPDKNILVYRKTASVPQHNSSKVSLKINGSKQCCRCSDHNNSSAQNSVNSGSIDCLKSLDSTTDSGAYTVLQTSEASTFSVLWSSAIPMNKIIRIKQVTRTCLNDVILASLAGAIRRSFQKLGVVNPANLKVK